jgi:N-dimethylarginine dimethylaminohydrolase
VKKTSPYRPACRQASLPLTLEFMKNKLIKKVLMCKPLHFSELDYVINPWMKPGTIDGEKALSEWEQLVNIYRKENIAVEVIDQKQGVPDMVFATDQGIIHGKTVLLSRFWYDERKNETPYYEEWFTKHGYQIEYLPIGAFFEGNGDSYFWGDKLLIGVGFRADDYTCRAVSKILDIEVIPLQIVDPKFYHLDVGFLPINSETAFYYPKAFTKQSREVLKKLIPNLIEFTRDEVNAFSANSVVTDHHVIHQKGSETFKAKLKDLRYKSIEVDVSEFIKSGGGAHCMTSILEEGWGN